MSDPRFDPRFQRDYSGPQIYNSTSQTQGPSSAEVARAQSLYQQSSALLQLVTPLSVGSLACGAAILVVLGRRWQLRRPPASEMN